ncbi:nuclear transport factor 2 family protein [Flavobacteriaceae bacterium]|nr:nuclear transport factor 2 family protein [Flavobacteriaceae bacterium]
MKNIYTILLVGLFTVSCNNSNSSETSNLFGEVKQNDEKSQMVQKLFEAVEAEDASYLQNIFSDDLKHTNPDGVVVNKEEFMTGIENIFDMFDNIKFKKSEYEEYENLEIETTYYKNGKIWTNIWSEMSAKGNYSGNEMNFRFHISYLWDGDKIIEEVQFFNPTAFNSEGLAKEMSLDK